MSINLWDTGDLFTARCYKSIASRPDLKWANTYELQVTAGGAGAGVEAAEQASRAIAEFEAQYHLADVRFDRVVFSTYVPDGEPYDPDTFASYNVSDLSGTRVPAGEVNAQPLQVCLLMRKAVSFGRAGRFLYRRVLTEAEVTSTAGDPALAAGVAATLDALIDANLPSSGQGLFGTIGDLGLNLVMAGVSGGITRVRAVNTLAAVGVTIKKYNNRYFDRVLG